MPPAPPDAVGLRHWTVVLDADALASLRGRVEAAGLEFEDRDGGVLLDDPWGNAVLFASVV